MKAKITIIILSVLLAICIVIIALVGVMYKKSPHCDNGEPFDIKDQSTWYDKSPNFFDLPTKKDVEKIEKGMPLEDVVAILGKPLCHVKLSSSLDYAWATTEGYVYFRLNRKHISDENGNNVEKYYVSRQMPAERMDQMMK